MENVNLDPQVETEHDGLSDDAVDGIAAITLIAVTVSAIVFWLSALPS